MLTVPRELEEAARIDGASRWQAMLRIVLPLCTPGLLSAGIFAFTLAQADGRGPPGLGPRRRHLLVLRRLLRGGSHRGLREELTTAGDKPPPYEGPAP